jgi:hypothetical protein
VAVRESDEQKFTKLRDAAEHARLPYESEWWLNVAFFLGHQYMEWSEVDNNLRVIAPRTGQEDAPRPVVNKIEHFVNQQHAFALQNRPIPEVIPANDDLVSQSDAAVALSYVQYAAELAEYDSAEELATLWAIVAGTSFKKWTWDPVQHRCNVQALTPFDLFLDPYATNWDDVRYVIHSRFMDPEQVYDQWGVELKSKGERTDETRAKYLRGMGLAPVVQGVTVSELWMKPSRRHPEGLFAVWSGQETIVPRQKLPYTALREKRQLPFTIQGVIPRPGTPYYRSPVTSARPPQMELNKYHAQKIMTRENFANLKWLEPEESNLAQPISNHHFQVLKGSFAEAKPEIVAPPVLPDNGDGEWLVEEMMHVMGLHEVSQAQVPGRVESAKAIEMLKEADATRLSVLSATTQRSIERGFWYFTAFAHEFEEERKMISVYSEDGITEVKEFRAREVDLGLRFKVTMGTGLGYSKAGRTENLYNLWDRGLLQDDPGRMLALLDVGGNLPLSATARDIRLARNENYEMAKGIAVKANSWDNHQVHIREHNDYRKSTAFRLLTPRSQAIYEFHVKLHEQLYSNQLNEDAMYAAVAQGAGLQSAAPPGAEAAPPAEGAQGPTQPPAGAQAEEPPE